MKICNVIDDLYAGFPAFSVANPHDIARALPLLEEKTLKAGEVIYEAGDEPAAAYLVTSGEVEIFSESQLLDSVTAGLIGEEAGVPGEHYRGKTVACCDTTVITIPQDILLKLMRTDSIHSEVFASYVNHYVTHKRQLNGAPDKQDHEKSLSLREILGWSLAMILPVLIMLFGDTWNLQWNAKVFMAIFSSTVIMWVFRVTSEFVPALFAVLSLIILGVVPKEVVLSGFTSHTFFMAMSIFGLGAVLVASGLAYRTILLLIRWLPKNQTAYWTGMTGIGLLMTPILPSANTRSALVSPLLLDLVRTLRYQYRGKAATRLAMGAFVGASLFSPIFLTSKAANFIAYGLLPEQVRAQFDWLNWAIAAAGAGVVLFVLVAIASKWIFSNTEMPRVSRQLVTSQLKIMGPLNGFEWAAFIGMLFLTIGIFTSSIHKIAPAWVALVMVFALLTVGALSNKQFKERIDWSFLFLLAAMIGVVHTMQYTGLDQWIGGHLGWMEPYIKQNFELFVLFLSVAVMLVRLAVPNTTTTILFSTVFIPMASAHGVNPWVVMFIILVMSDAWFFRYQCSYYLLFANLSKEGRLYDGNQMITFNLLINAFRLIAIYASIPIWKGMAIL
ncbi:MAG: anion permease [Gammaproteobacteria bacterium]|nr:anion permease [Gammaproteobacteria bacterium]